MRANMWVVGFVVLVGCGSGPGVDQPVCPVPSGAGTEHNGASALTSSETWSASGSPHLVTGDLRIGMGGTLTIEPCVEVRMRGPRIITVQAGGTLLAEGTEKRPIRVVPEDAAGFWGFVQVYGPKTSRFAWVSIEGGGNEPANSYAALEARGDQLAPAQPVLFVDHVTVKNSQNYGVSLRSGAGFTSDSHDLVITGSKKAPLRVLPRLVTNIPNGTYTGNAEDVVQVETEAYGDITLEDVIFKDRGLHYKIGGPVTEGMLKAGGGDRKVTLTLEAGVVLEFKKSGAAGLAIDTGTTDNPATGALIAVGTETKPIVLTSAAPFKIAGDWRGVTFGNRPDATGKLDFVHVEYAGAPSQAKGFHCIPGGVLSNDEDAAITLYGQPTVPFITNTTVLSSAALGINLAYKGMTYDFLTSNTFMSVVGCKQSTPRNMDGACPSNVSCP